MDRSRLIERHGRIEASNPSIASESITAANMVCRPTMVDSFSQTRLLRRRRVPGTPSPQRGAADKSEGSRFSAGATINLAQWNADKPRKEGGELQGRWWVMRNVDGELSKVSHGNRENGRFEVGLPFGSRRPLARKQQEDQMSRSAAAMFRFKPALPSAHHQAGGCMTAARCSSGRAPLHFPARCSPYPRLAPRRRSLAPPTDTPLFTPLLVWRLESWPAAGLVKTRDIATAFPLRLSSHSAFSSLTKALRRRTLSSILLHRSR